MEGGSVGTRASPASPNQEGTGFEGAEAPFESAKLEKNILKTLLFEKKRVILRSQQQDRRTFGALTAHVWRTHGARLAHSRRTFGALATHV